MTSVSVLFYGRRIRSTRITSDSDDLGFLSSSDRSHPDCYPSHRHRNTSRKTVSTSNCGRTDRRHLHPRTDQHHRQNHRVPPAEFEDRGGSSGFLRQPCSDATGSDSGPIQQYEDVTEAPVQNIVHGDILSSIRSRINSNERLPRSVLLARERLLTRLRGVSAPSVRESHESHSGTHFDSHWLNDSGNWHSRNSGENLEVPGLLLETILKPLPLDREPLASLHHEIFTEVTEADGSPKFSDSDECSICLERFVEGDELIDLQCGHRFHSSCLCPWIQTCRKCPYCRSEI